MTRLHMTPMACVHMAAPEGYRGYRYVCERTPDGPVYEVQERVRWLWLFTRWKRVDDRLTAKTARLRIAELVKKDETRGVYKR